MAIKFFENTSINEHTIDLIKDEQLYYGPIYALGSIELKMLKTYIKIHLKPGFIQSFNFLARATISFNKKPDDNLCLYVNYQGLDNLITKNQYLMPFLKQFLDWLDQAKKFIQLGLTSIHHKMRI